MDLEWTKSLPSIRILDKSSLQLWVYGEYGLLPNMVELNLIEAPNAFELRMVIDEVNVGRFMDTQVLIEKLSKS